MSQYCNTSSKRLHSVVSTSSLHSSFSDASWDSQTVATPASEHDMFQESCMNDASAYANSFPLLSSNNQDFMALAMSTHQSQLPYSPNSSFGSTIDLNSTFECSPLYSTHPEPSYIHGLPSPPLDMAYSIHLPQLPYVAPSDLSFQNQYISSSPIRPQTSLVLQTNYHSSPISHHSNLSYHDLENSAYVNSIYHQRSSMTPASSIASTPSRPSRIFKAEPLESSTALQQIQDHHLNATRRKIKKERRNKRAAERELYADVISKSEYPCTVDGCKATFGKSEHWKRHEETVHAQNDRFPCNYCAVGNKKKEFQNKRLDNYKTHLELHLVHTPRTHFNLEAITAIADLIKNRKVKKGAKKATSSEPLDIVDEVMGGIKQELDEGTITACRTRLEHWKENPDTTECIFGSP